MAKLNIWTFEHFIGIDVSKLFLDLAIMERSSLIANYKVDNNTESINIFLREIKSTHGVTIKKSIFGMEHTGLYCNHLIETLEKIKANIVVEDAGHLKKSMGTIRGKSDKLDASRIAKYLVQNRDGLVLRNHKRNIIFELARLCSLRERLVSVLNTLVTPLKEEKSFVKYQGTQTTESLCNTSVMAMKSDIAGLEKYIKSVWKADRRLDRLMTVIMSVPGVGPVTALQILISTNEFNTIKDTRKFACYCGVAPFQHTSGTSIHKLTRVSRIANIKVKTLLHSCALSARRFVPEIRDYYERKTKVEGKHSMCVMNAIRFKIIARIFACVNGDRLYQKEFPQY